ncbi:transposase [Chroococcidiopsis sp. TS-821]|uniref:transposase n=1 Tax=Chroococcidiopsis sp. TS-821 TaxID=1378066 RepID=UPI001AEFEA16|nr:transposase [Chroococcidiopsis sp. TS-821]
MPPVGDGTQRRLVEFETGKIIATAVEKGKTHDFKLLQRCLLPFVPSQLCLADRGYQRFGKLPYRQDLSGWERIPRFMRLVLLQRLKLRLITFPGLTTY